MVNPLQGQSHAGKMIVYGYMPACIPYMHLNQPRFGEVHVTSESNHAAYANIMIGVKVNRYPANYGFLCSKNRFYARVWNTFD